MKQIIAPDHDVVYESSVVGIEVLNSTSVGFADNHRVEPGYFGAYKHYVIFAATTDTCLSGPEGVLSTNIAGTI